MRRILSLGVVFIASNYAVLSLVAASYLLLVTNLDLGVCTLGVQHILSVAWLVILKVIKMFCWLGHRLIT